MHPFVNLVKGSRSWLGRCGEKSSALLIAMVIQF